MLTYEQALARILKAVPSPRTTVVKLDDSLGLVLATPMTAPCDLPLFDNSAVDGYAIRSHDVPQSTNGHPAYAALRVIGAAEAGRPCRAPMGPGEAVRILTGAQVPPGADAVVMQEHVKRHGGQIVIQRWPAPGQNIRRRGEDLHRGARALEAGTGLRPQELGLLAALGLARVPVYPRPRVAILTTGNELQPPGTRLKPGQIYESNGSLLRALVQQAGAQVVNLGTVQDAVASLIPRIRRGLACDLLIIAGGVSVGDKDFVRRAAQRCGVRQRFWRVNIKPGMPLFFGRPRPQRGASRGRRHRTLVFGLPGNPVSVYVTFEEFVKPALSRLMGRPWEDHYQVHAVLADDLKVSTTRRTHFIRVQCVNGQGSHRLRSLVEADGWIRMNAEEGPWPAGTPVSVKRETI